MGAPDVPTIAGLRRARRALNGVARQTPLLVADGLSTLTGHPVYLKCENLQRTGSFKLRGAYVKISGLSGDERARGVIAASAGNHGLGVALAAKLVGAPATIVLPESASLVKVTAIQALGARAALHGSSYEDAYQRAVGLASEQQSTFVHPFDDWHIITGQGTVMLEILDQLPETGVVLAPVGGGGLIAGVALAARAARRSVRVVGVQASGASAAVESFRSGRREPRSARTVADGIRVGEPGEKAFQVMQGQVDAMVTVEEDEIYRAVVYLLETVKLVVEPAGAVGVAALLARRIDLPPDASAVVIVSGGNVDPNLLGHFIEYGMVHSGRSLLLRARLPDRPGQLMRLLTPLSERRVNVLNIEHHRASWGLPVDVSEVLLHLETRGPEHRAEVIATLRSLDVDVEPLLPTSFGDET
ncbi:MAG: threonine ammonia-lyase [Chloroflexota bacterium]